LGAAAAAATSSISMPSAVWSPGGRQHWEGGREEGGREAGNTQLSQTQGDIIHMHMGGWTHLVVGRVVCVCLHFRDDFGDFCERRVDHQLQDGAQLLLKRPRHDRLQLSIQLEVPIYGNKIPHDTRDASITLNAEE